jgi:hypothetical protein
MQARVLAYSDDRQWVTAELALFGPPQSRDRNFEWRPSLDFIWRRKLSAALALDSGFGIHAEVSRTAEKNISRAYIGRIGALWQMLDRVAVLPSVQVMNESGSMKAMYLGEVPVGDGWRVPLGLEIATVLYRDQRRQVELGLQGTWFHLGYENDFTSFPVYLTLAYSW